MIKNKMMALVLHAPGDLRYEEVNVPKIGPNDVLMQIEACAMCGSDPYRIMVSGTYRHPTIPGHESAGVVVKAGECVENVKVGDRVSIAAIIPCMKCDWCYMGEYTICDNYDFIGSRSDGAYAEFVKAPSRNCFIMPEVLSFEEAACIDPICVALHGIRQAGGIDVGDDVAVLGMGPIGLYAIQWAKIFGARQIYAVDLLREKLELAKELGADVLIDASEQDVVKTVLDMTNKQGVELVMETAGSSKTQLMTIQIVKKLGNVVLIGTSHSDILFEDKIFTQIYRKECRLMGSINYRFVPPHNEWVLSQDYIVDGRFKVKPIISHKFKFSEGPKMFKKLYNREFLFNKVIFVPDK